MKFYNKLATVSVTSAIVMGSVLGNAQSTFASSGEIVQINLPMYHIW